MNSLRVSRFVAVADTLTRWQPPTRTRRTVMNNPVSPLPDPDAAREGTAAYVSTGSTAESGVNSASTIDDATPTAAATGQFTSFGEYDLLELIAHGGMGMVYKARDRKLNRIVALKMILPGRLSSAEAARRFRTEAEAAARLDHSNIVPVYESGECAGRHYIAMAFIDGGSLASRLREGPLPAREGADLVRQLAAAIAY